MIFVLGNTCMLVKTKYREQALQLKSVKDAVRYIHIDPAESKMDLLVLSDEIFIRPDSKKLAEAIVNKHPDVNILCLCVKSLVDIEGVKSVKIKDMKAPVVLTEIEKMLRIIMNELSPELTPFSSDIIEVEEDEESEDIDWETPEQNLENQAPNSSKGLDAEKLRQQAKSVSEQALKELHKSTKGIKEKIANVQIVVEVGGSSESEEEVEVTPLYNADECDELSIDATQNTRRVVTNVSLDNHTFGIGEYRPGAKELELSKVDITRAVYDSLEFMNIDPTTIVASMSEMEQYETIALAFNKAMKAKGEDLRFETITQESLNAMEAQGVLPVNKEYIEFTLPRMKQGALNSAAQTSLQFFDETKQQAVMSMSELEKYETIAIVLNSAIRSQGIPLNFSLMTADEVDSIPASTLPISKEHLQLILPEMQRLLRTNQISFENAEKVEVTNNFSASEKIFEKLELALHSPSNVSYGLNFEAVQQAVQVSAPMPMEYSSLLIPELRSRDLTKAALTFMEKNKSYQETIPQLDWTNLEHNLELSRAYNDTLRSLGVQVAFEDLVESQIDSLSGVDRNTQEYMKFMLPQLKLIRANEIALTYLRGYQLQTYRNAYDNITTAADIWLQNYSVKLTELSEAQLRGLPEFPWDVNFISHILPQLRLRMAQKLSLSFIDVESTVVVNELAQCTQYKELIAIMNRALYGKIGISFENMTSEQLDALPEEMLPYNKEYLLMVLPSVKQAIAQVSSMKNIARGTQYENLVAEVNQRLVDNGIHLSYDSMTHSQLQWLPQEVLVYDKAYLLNILSDVKQQFQYKTLAEARISTPSYANVISVVDATLSTSFLNLTPEQLAQIPQSSLPYPIDYLQFVLAQLKWNDYSQPLNFQEHQKAVSDVALVATTETQRDVYNSMQLTFTDKVSTKTYFVSLKDLSDMILRKTSHVYHDAIMSIFSKSSPDLLDMLSYSAIYDGEQNVDEFWSTLPILEGFNTLQKYYLLYMMPAVHKYELLYYNYSLQGQTLSQENLEQLFAYAQAIPSIEQTLQPEQQSVVNIYVTRFIQTLRVVDTDLQSAFVKMGINTEVISSLSNADKLALSYAINFPEDRILLRNIDIPEQVLNNAQWSSLSYDIRQLLWQSTSLQTKCLFVMEEYATASSILASLPPEITQRYDLYTLDEARLQILQSKFNL